MDWIVNIYNMFTNGIWIFLFLYYITYMNTPPAKNPQATVMSPTGESVPRTGPGVDLMGAFTEEAEIAGLQTGGEAKTTDVIRL